MSDAAQIYCELGVRGAEKYAMLVKEEAALVDLLTTTGSTDEEALKTVRDAIYQLKQEANIVSSR